MTKSDFIIIGKSVRNAVREMRKLAWRSRTEALQTIA